MSARNSILSAIKTNQPALLPKPSMVMQREVIGAGAAVEQFIKTLESIGGKVVSVSGTAAIREQLEQSRQGGAYIVNTVAALGPINTEIVNTALASTLEPVFTAYVEASLGVAENGSVWLYESQLQHRVLPFICQHLVVCLHVQQIVPTMHEAYAQIDIARDGYGVFLAGPSKTADIEQSLVIGAHGARSLLLYLIS